MIKYTGKLSDQGESRFLLDDADDIKSLPTGLFEYNGKTYPAPLQGSIALVQETGERYTFNGESWSAGAVLYTEQTLTDEQKAQARENIGAVTLDEVMDSLYDAEEVAY